MAAWLRLGEIASQESICEPFDATLFKAALEEIRTLTCEPPDVFFPRMRELCATAGVALVLVPAIPGAGVSGITRWLTPHKALIQLSLFGKYNDRFWYTFFHEACHVLKHGKSLVFVENDKHSDDPQEREADRFAADILIPRGKAAELDYLEPTSDAVQAFAAELGIHPGIVLGRMQQEGRIAHASRLNELKDRFELVSPDGP